MVGQKLGEFAKTLKSRGHARKDKRSRLLSSIQYSIEER